MSDPANNPAESWDSAAAAMLALGLHPVTPPPSLRERMLERTPARSPRLLPGFQEELPGFAVLRKGEGSWKPTPFPGVEFLTLAADRESTSMTTLLRMAPGASYPPHHHTVGEQCLVLEGDVRQQDQDLSLHAGDFFHAAPATDHRTITTNKGCLLLIVSSSADYFL